MAETTLKINVPDGATASPAHGPAEHKREPSVSVGLAAPVSPHGASSVREKERVGGAALRRRRARSRTPPHASAAGPASIAAALALRARWCLGDL